MKKAIITISLILVYVTLNSQNNVTIVHREYKTLFSKEYYYPIKVEWWLTREKVSCINPMERIDKFEKDPEYPTITDLANSYTKSGYDRGHMCPSADNLCLGETVAAECFYYSNMVPQVHSLNAGDWKLLEEYSRSLAKLQDSIMIWAGSVGSIKKIGMVSVPEKCWKVIYIKKLNLYKAYIFNNIKTVQTGILSHQVPLSKVEDLTGFTFNIGDIEIVQDSIENTCNYKQQVEEYVSSAVKYVKSIDADKIKQEMVDKSNDIKNTDWKSKGDDINKKARLLKEQAEKYFK